MNILATLIELSYQYKLKEQKGNEDSFWSHIFHV